jgi:hypothetical protein
MWKLNSGIASPGQQDISRHVTQVVHRYFDHKLRLIHRKGLVSFQVYMPEAIPFNSAVQADTFWSLCPSNIQNKTKNIGARKSAAILEAVLPLIYVEGTGLSLPPRFPTLTIMCF